ncbi:MAG: hypothetical protein HFG34_01465 [Eubacterium sp.]|nr:hypothetical protein [Eubacterium sp.]
MKYRLLKIWICVLVLFMTGCSGGSNSTKEPAEAAADRSPAVAETEEPQESDRQKTLYNNPIDEYFLPKIQSRGKCEAEIRGYQDNYKHVWKEEFENLTKWLRKKCIYEEDKENIIAIEKSVSEYIERSKAVISTELLDTYEVNPNPKKGKDMVPRNSYWGTGTRSRLNQIEGEIYRDTCMRIICLYGAETEYKFRKVDYSEAKE